MITIRNSTNCYNNQFTINGQHVGIAIFGINNLGPIPLVAEDNTQLELVTDHNFLQNFAIYSVMASTQGSYYTNQVFLLPVAQYPDHHAIIISRLNSSKDPIHQQFSQVVVFIPTTLARRLPSVISIENELHTIVNQIDIIQSPTQDNAKQLKCRLLKFLDQLL